MKALLEFLPIIVFFIGYKVAGLAVATIAIMVVSVALLGYRYMSTKKWDKILIVSTALILIMGGLTLIFDNPIFVQYKLSVLYGLLVITLWVCHRFFQKNWVAWMIRQALPINDHTGKKLLWGMLVFFSITAILNVVLIHTITFDTWVTVKTVGMTAALIVFAIWQGFMVMQDPEVREFMAKDEK